MPDTNPAATDDEGPVDWTGVTGRLLLTYVPEGKRKEAADFLALYREDARATDYRQAADLLAAQTCTCGCRRAVEFLRSLADAVDVRSRAGAGAPCPRCDGSGIDPEHSYEGRFIPGQEEPPVLEPCTACQFPTTAAPARTGD